MPGFPVQTSMKGSGAGKGNGMFLAVLGALPSVRECCVHGTAPCQLPTDVGQERSNLQTKLEKSLAAVLRGESQTVLFSWWTSPGLYALQKATCEPSAAATHKECL